MGLFFPLMELVDEIVEDIIARVPRIDYPSLSLVSRHFRPIVASPELYARRSSLGCTEHCLYAVLLNPTHNCRWYILIRKPNSNRLVPIPSLPHMRSRGRYVPAGEDDRTKNSISWSALGIRIDCTSHKAQPISDCPEPIAGTVADIDDGKTYVIGDCRREDNWVKGIKVFNRMLEMTKPEELLGRMWYDCVVTAGKVHTSDPKYLAFVVFNPKTKVLDPTEWKTKSL